jgi:hypothetical protein
MPTGTLRINLSRMAGQNLVAPVLPQMGDNSRARIFPRSTVMLRKTIVALLAVAAVGLLSPSVASARDGFGGHGGGFHGAFHGGGLHGHGLAFEFGLYTPYALHGAYGYPNAYSDDDDTGCYVVQRRVHTRHGWRLRPFEVCG